MLSPDYPLRMGMSLRAWVEGRFEKRSGDIVVSDVQKLSDIRGEPTTAKPVLEKIL